MHNNITNYIKAPNKPKTNVQYSENWNIKEVLSPHGGNNIQKKLTQMPQKKFDLCYMIRDWNMSRMED